MRINTNRTHYLSEDIEAAVKALSSALKKEAKRGWTVGKGEEEIGVRYWAGVETPPMFRKKSLQGLGWRWPSAKAASAVLRKIPSAAQRGAGDEPWDVQYVSTSVRGGNLRILSPDAADALQTPLQQLAALGFEQRQLPDEAVAQIAAMGCFFAGFRAGARLRREKLSGIPLRARQPRGTLDQLLLKARQVVADEGLVIRVAEKVQSPRLRKKPKEKSVYWGKVYLSGGRAKKLDWRLQNTLKPAVKQYELAWHETLEQLERAKKAGAEVEPHKNPAEILRLLADKWERDGSF